jgi:hypothetical protein
MFRGIINLINQSCESLTRGFEALGYVADAGAVRAKVFSTNQRATAAISEVESLNKVARRLADQEKTSVTKAQREAAEKLIASFGN